MDLSKLGRRFGVGCPKCVRPKVIAFVTEPALGPDVTTFYLVVLILRLRASPLICGDPAPQAAPVSPAHLPSLTLLEKIFLETISRFYALSPPLVTRASSLSLFRP